jgi:hypothetical protein
MHAMARASSFLEGAVAGGCAPETTNKVMFREFMHRCAKTQPKYGIAFPQVELHFHVGLPGDLVPSASLTARARDL